MRVSRSLRDTAYRALQAKEAFIREHQREPDIVELARLMDVPKEEVVFALDAILDRCRCSSRCSTTARTRSA